MRTILSAATAAAIGIACATSAGAATINGLTFSVTADQDYYNPEPFSYGYVTLGGSTAGM